MSKIIISYCIKSSEQNETIKDIKGIKNDNTIIYNQDNIIVKIRVDNNKVFINRENDNLKISLEFEKNKFLMTKYFIKNLNLELNLKTETKNLIIKDNCVLIEYDLYMNDEFSDSFMYNLEWRDL